MVKNKYTITLQDGANQVMEFHSFSKMLFDLVSCNTPNMLDKILTVENTPLLRAAPEPATPTAQWQKEAEERADEYVKHRFNTFKMKNLEHKAFATGFTKARELAHAEKLQELSAKDAEHTAHMEQVQREVDAACNFLNGVINTIDGLDGAHPNTILSARQTLSRLRSITQTKTDKG